MICFNSVLVFWEDLNSMNCIASYIITASLAKSILSPDIVSGVYTKSYDIFISVIIALLDVNCLRA